MAMTSNAPSDPDPGSPVKRRALELFRGLPGRYDRLSAALSFGQDPRWRRALVDAVAPAAGERILDVATGTGMVAAELLARADCAVVGLDQSPEMLAAARARFALEARARFTSDTRARFASGVDGVSGKCGEHGVLGTSGESWESGALGGLGGRVELIEGQAERLPFADGAFDALTFTYLLRYVEDPAATVRELARVVRPGGRIASLEFGVPPRALPRLAWRFYTAVGLPVLGAVLGGPSAREWAAVGRFLGPSIAGFYAHHPLPAIAGYWHDAGLTDVRIRRMSLGGGIVMSAIRTDARAT